MKKKIALAALAIIPMTSTNVYASGKIGIVTADSLNVRSGASTNNSVLFTVKKDEKVNINQTLDGWYNIKVSDGKEGWAPSAHISIQNSDDSSYNALNLSGVQKKVNTNDLNMRSGAGTSYRILMKLKKGSVVDVISQSNGWVKIKYDGRLGYVAGQYLDAIKEDTSKETIKEVNTEGLNVRTGPSTSYSILGKLKKGQKIGVIYESNGWSKINYNGKVAYTSSRYLNNVSNPSNPTPIPPKPEEKPDNIKETKIVNTNGLNVRSGPGTNHGKVGTLKKGEKVGVISQSNGWSKISYNGKVAYVASHYLDKDNSNPTPIPPKPEEKPDNIKETKIVNTNGLNVRSGPGTNHGKVGTLKKGEKVGVISQSNGWSKISYNGKVAYVASHYLDKDNLKPTPPKPDEDNSSSTKPEGDNSQNVNGATINNKGLNYTLEDHIRVQEDRVSAGANVISSSRPRSSEVMSTFIIKESRAFVPANRSDLEYFLNPSNFTKSKKGMMQFLRIDSYKGGVSASELNSYLNSLPSTSSGRNVFYNQGQVFINTAQKYNIDLVYLVSHAMWETGYGKSTLAQGQTITSYKGKPLPSPVTVYNFFGIGAFDKTANVSGAEAAYSNGWTSIEKTIDGSAKWIASNYIKSSKYNQNTIYKMKFNYDHAWHQYATDVNWANGISGIMNKIISMYDRSNNIVFEVPNYKK